MNAFVGLFMLLSIPMTVFVLVGIYIYLTLWLRLPSAMDPDDYANLCETCGYDLRGTPGRCPECGTPVDEGQPSAALAKLRDEWPSQAIEIRLHDPAETPTVVLTSGNGKAVYLLSEHLQARGIAAECVTREVPTGGGHFADFYDLVVWSADTARARDIVRRLWPAGWLKELR